MQGEIVKMNTIDVVTVVAGIDLKNIQLVLDSLTNRLNVNKVFVITNAVEKVPRSESVVVIDEKELISTSDINKMKNIPVAYFPTRFGWYYQQFLKMQFAKSTYCQGDYLIWDADTVLLKPLDLIEEGKYIFTVGKEKLNKDYHITYERLLGNEPKVKSSMISQHLFVNKKIMVALIDEITDKYNQPFYFSILENCIGSGKSLFSEYETYVNYAIEQKLPHVIKERVWFRNAAAIVGYTPSDKTLKRFFYMADFIALEKFDIRFTRKCKGLLMYSKFILSYFLGRKS
ncbi:DUF6492 family protein [Pseudoalteromonas sp. B131b]|uniref:DUF6492 family protein n=1 Tax=Pseudoalteromonas sp. B131b TaxID=630493 RepID=UPI00301CF2AE